MPTNLPPRAPVAAPLWIAAIVAVRLWRVWIARLAFVLLRASVALFADKPLLRGVVHAIVWLSLATTRWAFPDMKLPPASELLAEARARAERRRRHAD
jgi:hypothetical protein